MGVSWLGALCLIECGAIIWLSGFMCSSIRFHRKQQDEIQQLRESGSHWREMARTLDDEKIELQKAAEDQRHENESAKRALEFFDEMRRALEKYDDGPIVF